MLLTQWGPALLNHDSVTTRIRGDNVLIGVPKESRAGETLVAATPDTGGKLVRLGYEVCVEAGAGERSSYPDEQYRAAGAQIVDAQGVWAADIITTLDTPSEAKLLNIRRGATLIARMDPAAHPEVIERLATMGVTSIAMDAVPRISRAQSIDVLSSMANVAGYRAVVEAARAFGRLFTGQMTAAGKVPPANVYVIGAGVAGLAAIGTASSLGAVVKGTDVRPETADQVKSLGGQFVEIPVSQESSDGYAQAMSTDQEIVAREIYAREAVASDIVITTALIPGRPAPLLITADVVAAMKPGSVIVDLGAANGGNCELTVPGKVIVTDNGVTIIGYTDLAGRLPGQASQLYGRNIFKLATPGNDGTLPLDMDDDVVRAMTVTLHGIVMWPPPPIKVSAARAAREQEPPPVEPVPVRAEETPSWVKPTLGVLGALVAALVYFAPRGMSNHFVVFTLACVVGFYVITNVTHSLHTPLMSVTNAISGIIVVGALWQIGFDNALIQGLAFVATVVASINIFGGFTVTHRMLKMFQRS